MARFNHAGSTPRGVRTPSPSAATAAMSREDEAVEPKQSLVENVWNHEDNGQ